MTRKRAKAEAATERYHGELAALVQPSPLDFDKIQQIHEVLSAPGGSILGLQLGALADAYGFVRARALVACMFDQIERALTDEKAPD